MDDHLFYGMWKKEYTISFNHQPYHVLFVKHANGECELRLFARRDVMVKVKPEDVNLDMGPFAHQLEPYARVLCARLELEK